jgi:hypothetical protein
MAETIAAHEREARAIEAGERERRERGVTVREWRQSGWSTCSTSVARSRPR